MPPGGEKHHRAVQPAAADDKRRTELRPAEGRKLQGEAESNPKNVVSYLKGFFSLVKYVIC